MALQPTPLPPFSSTQVAQAQAAHTVATHAVAAGNVQVAHAAHSVQALQACGGCVLEAGWYVVILVLIQ